MKMKKSACFTFLILLVISTGALAQVQRSPSPYFLTPDTITIASEPDYPPFCLVNENGSADGFSVELFRAAAEAVGLHVNIKIGLWDEIKRELAEGKIDALPLVGRTPEREELYEFTMPYLSLHGAVFVRKGTTGIASLEDLKDKEIAVMKGDNAEEFVRREQISDKIFTTHTFEEAFRELADGRYDAVITQRIMGLRLLDEMKIRSVEPLDFQIPGFRQDFCFAVRKGDTLLRDRLNEGLSIIIANDTFEKIRDKWFGPAYKEKISPLDFFKMALFIFVPLLIIMSLFWIFSLRREVKRQTESLNAEIAEHKQTLKALRESEEKYRSMIMNLMEGFFSVTIAGELLDYNPEFARILKLDSHKDQRGANLTDFWQNPKDRELYLKQLLDRGFVKNYIIPAKQSDGQKIVILVSARLVRDRHGNPLRIESSCMDITGQQKNQQELLVLKNSLEKTVAERTVQLQEKIAKLDKSEKAMLFMVEDLNKMTAELQEERRKLLLSNEELEAFTYSVSHDLRAPLRAINGYARFLLEDYAEQLDDEGKRFINTIRQNAEKMDELISDLLNLSRVSRSTLSYNEVDMGAVAESMYYEIASAQQQEEFTLHFGEMPNARCDLTLIKQVWQNLISNALKYSARSDVKKIEIGGRDADGELVYWIKDHGAGFDNEYKDKLFGVFQRLHSEEEFEGTGVGLAIVQRIIHRHGGRVWAEGEPDKGACFYFSLPNKR